MTGNRYLTIRQTAKTGLATEYQLRLMHAQGKLPGVFSGNRFKVNVDMLERVLEKESERESGANEHL